MGISKIPLVTFLYVYTFLQIKLSHQADGDVKRLVKTNAFLVNGRNTLTIEKCPENSEFFYLQAFGVCRNNVNDLNEKTTIWMVPEHNPPESGKDTVETLKASANPLLRAYYVFCENAFSTNKDCQLSINKVESGDDRFRTEQGLECKDEGQSIFNGVLFCIEKNGSPVDENEVVTLVGFMGHNIEAWCPEDRKIKTLTAFESSSPLVNKGMVESFYGEATKRCDGNEKCTLTVNDKEKFKRFRVFTYKCVQ